MILWTWAEFCPSVFLCFDCHFTLLQRLPRNFHTQFAHENHEGQADILMTTCSSVMEKFVTKCSECSHTRAEKCSTRKPKFHVRNVMPKSFPKLVQGFSLVSTLLKAEC